MKDLNIENLPIDAIIPYQNNPRNNDEAVEHVANSIREFGFKVPIVIDKKNVVVTGHTRLKAAKKLGLDNVPCIRADDLTEEQIKAFRIADNKVGEIATWDFAKLDLELEDLEIDMTAFGLDFESFESGPDEIPDDHDGGDDDDGWYEDERERTNGVFTDLNFSRQKDGRLKVTYTNTMNGTKNNVAFIDQSGKVSYRG